jgi:hypothetical protein
VALATIFSHYAHADIHVDASLDSNSFSVDEGAQLSVTIEGASHGASVELPEISGVDIQSRGQSTQINMVNGSFSSSVVYNYQLTAEQPGNYTIDPIKVYVSGATYATVPIQFQVTASDVAAQDGGDDTPRQEVAFLRVSPLGQHYSGEVVPVSIKAYFIDRYQANIESVPDLVGDGVVMDALNNKPKQTRELVNGLSYNVLTWKTGLSGIKTGEHPLQFSLDATVMIPQKGKRRSLFDDPFFGGSPFNDSFFNGVFSNAQPRHLKLKSGNAKFTVLPLPTEGRPAAFNGAIGDFDLKVTAKPVKAEVGEPISMTMTLSGHGNFDRVNMPEFPDQANWKTYTPTSQFYKEGSSADGTKIFDQAVIARDVALKAIPSLTFCYFDPVARRYVEKTSAPIPVELSQSQQQKTSPPPQPKIPPAPAVQTAKPAATAKDEGTAQFTPSPLKLEEGAFVKEIRSVFYEKWFIIAVLLIGAALLGIICQHLWGLWRERHPERERLHQREKLFAETFFRIEQAMATGDGAMFLAESKAAIQTQLGAKWHMPPSAVSLINLEQRLPSDSTVIALFRLADEAQYGFGAKGLSVQIMQDNFAKLQAELRELC